MDFSRAFNYVYEDEKWFEKVALGALISLVPILNFAMSGYMADVIRNVAKGETRPLPAWENLSDYFMKGLYLFVAGLAYGFIPSFILFPIIAVVLFVPMGILPLAAGVSEDAGTALAMAASIIFILAFSLVTLVGLLISILASLFSLIATIRFSTGEQTFNELFDIKGHWGYLKKNIGKLLLAVLYIICFSFIIMIPVWCLMVVLGFIPCLGQIVAYAVGMGVGMLIVLFSAHLYGQLAAETGLTSPTYTV
ncbi:MAG: DUF4013 domain-containing protein [Anaerolineae bacterium]|nr:DUF4013 domain-containing protein [Anaerolineae bacterium]